MTPKKSEAEHIVTCFTSPSALETEAGGSLGVQGVPALLSEFQPARATWEHLSSALIAGLCEGQFSSQTGHLDSSLVTLLRQLAHLISTDLSCISGFQGLLSGP